LDNLGIDPASLKSLDEERERNLKDQREKGLEAAKVAAAAEKVKAAAKKKPEDNIPAFMKHPFRSEKKFNVKKESVSSGNMQVKQKVKLTIDANGEKKFVPDTGDLPNVSAIDECWEDEDPRTKLNRKEFEWTSNFVQYNPKTTAYEAAINRKIIL
jgi:hypothetical protein